MPGRRGATAVLALALAAGCIAHPVGPARTYGKYKGKAVTTATSALSSVETARMAAGAARDSFGPYTATVVSDAEEEVLKAEGTFDSIQPPDERADALHDELSELLTNAADHVRDVRIAARRGEVGRLAEVAAPLQHDATRLREFTENNK